MVCKQAWVYSECMRFCPHFVMLYGPAIKHRLSACVPALQMCRTCICLSSESACCLISCHQQVHYAVHKELLAGQSPVIREHVRLFNEHHVLQCFCNRHNLPHTHSTKANLHTSQLTCMLTCRNFRVASSFMMWACPCWFMTWEIFSRALRSWIPTLVTPMGHGALPIARRR